MRSLVVIVALLVLGSPAFADFDRGCEAFERGDFEAAREEWQPLAEQGHAQAQFRLGCLYTFGQGVPEDYAMAARLFRLAAEQGDPDAQNNLGGMYAEGLGVEIDLVEAYMWLEIAAAGGHETAAKNREFLARSMSQEQVAAAQTRARAWLAEHR